MKFVKAIIKPFKLDSVREALAQIGVEGLTVTESKGYGGQRGQAEIYRSKDYSVDFLPKLVIDLAVDDEGVERVVLAIQNAARTGKTGDGKILVFDLAVMVRIRTGETGKRAL
jgi:nitrogen regulatory protein P-II 2